MYNYAVLSLRFVNIILTNAIILKKKNKAKPILCCMVTIEMVYYSEIGDLSLVKLSSEILQNLPYFLLRATLYFGKFTAAINSKLFKIKMF